MRNAIPALKKLRDREIIRGDREIIRGDREFIRVEGKKVIILQKEALEEIYSDTPQ